MPPLWPKKSKLALRPKVEGPVAPSDLWGRAYSELRVDNVDLVRALEGLLDHSSHNGTTLGASPGSTDVVPSQKQMAEVVDTQLTAMKQKQWRVQIGRKPIEVREQVDRIIKIILVAKDFISAAASMDPLHAGLPWAGVCMLLPLMTNDNKERSVSMDGLEYIAKLIRRYAEIERLFLGQPFRLHEDLQDTVIKLYTAVLEFQARAACQFSRKTIHQTLRNMFAADGWQDILTTMKDHETTAEIMMRIIDTEDRNKRVERLENLIVQQDKCVADLLKTARQEMLTLKFSKEDEKLQRELLAELQSSHQDQNSWRLSSEERKCFECLRTTDYEFYKDRVPHRIPGTLQWFLSHPKYQAWETSVRSSWLWVTADPGCGKSVLSRFLVDKFTASAIPAIQSITGLTSAGSSTTELTVCYFFFKDDSEESKSGTNAVSSLLHQLFTQKKELLRHALPAHKENGEKMKELFDVLWGIFQTAVADPKAGRITVILDALDECAESHRFILISKIASLFSDSRGKALGNLNLIATSRPHTSIGDQLWHDRVDIPSIHLMGEGEAEMDAIKVEIDLVIREKVRMFRDLRQYRGIYDDVHDTILERLLAVDNRTYLWVSLIFPELEKGAGISAKKLNDVIQNLPTTVDEAYQRILSRSTNFDHARILLHIVLAAVRPLTLGEMNIALAVNDDSQCLDDIDLEPAVTFRTTVRELCGLFVSIRDERVYLIHQTAKEFLVMERKQDAVDALLTSKWKHSMDPLISHHILALTCVIYLRCVRSGGTPPKEGDSSQISAQEASVDGERGHFLKYAAVNWPYHYTRSYQNQTIVEKAAYICQYPAHHSTWLPLYWHAYERRVRSPRGLTGLMISAMIGFPNILSNLLTQDGAPVGARDYQGRNALMWALAEGVEGTACILIKHMHIVGTYSDDLFASLQAASVLGLGRSITLLLDLGVSPTERASDGWSAIRKIMTKGSKQTFQAMLSHTKNLSPDEHHWLFHRAVASGNEEIVRSFLESGANINVRGPDGETILGRAVTKGNVSVVRLLLENGADPDMKTLNAWTECDTGSGETPLIQAVIAANVKIVSLLLEAGADISVRNRNNMTALYVGVCNNGEDVIRAGSIVEMLLAKGADIHARIGNGDTPARRAIRNDHHPIVWIVQDYLKETGEDFVLPEPMRLSLEQRDERLSLLKESGIVDMKIFSTLLEVEDDDGGPDFDFGRYRVRWGYKYIHDYVSQTRNGLITRNVYTLWDGIKEIHHEATTSLGLHKVGELASEWSPISRLWHVDSDERITDQHWEVATKNLLAIEDEVEIGKKLMQDFFRMITDSTVDFYP